MEMHQAIALLILLFQLPPSLAPSDFHDPATGVSLRLIDGWSAEPATHWGDHESTVVLHDAKHQAQYAASYFHPARSTVSDIEESLRADVPTKIASRKTLYPDYRLRKGSLESHIR
jgi:hypothetical protein